MQPKEALVRNADANHGDILSDQDVMELFKVTKEWLKEKRRKRCRNPIPYHDIGGAVRYYKPELLEWFHANRKRRSA
jgi:hypothetical protein